MFSYSDFEISTAIVTKQITVAINADALHREQSHAAIDIA